MKDKLLSIPFKFKIALSNEYSTSLKNERISFLANQTQNIKDWGFKTVIDERVDRFKNEIKINWGSDFLYSGINVALGKTEHIEKLISPNRLLNQLSMTNVVVSSEEFISALLNSAVFENRSVSLYPALSNLVFLHALKSFISIDGNDKTGELIDLLLSLDKIKENIKDEYIDLTHDFDLVQAESLCSKETIVEYVSFLNGLDLDLASHSTRYMASINNLHTINDSFNNIKHELAELLHKLSHYFEKMVILCSKIKILSSEVDFIFVDKESVTTPFDVHFTSFLISEFIEKSFSKLKETDEMEGILNDAENKINYSSSLNIFSSSSSSKFSHELMSISVKYRNKLNLCVQNFDDIDYISRLEIKDRIGLIVFEWYAYYVLDKCFRSKITSKFLLGLKKLDIGSLYISSNYNVFISR